MTTQERIAVWFVSVLLMLLGGIFSHVIIQFTANGVSKPERMIVLGAVLFVAGCLLNLWATLSSLISDD